MPKTVVLRNTSSQGQGCRRYAGEKDASSALPARENRLQPENSKIEEWEDGLTHFCDLSPFRTSYATFHTQRYETKASNCTTRTVTQWLPKASSRTGGSFRKPSSPLMSFCPLYLVVPPSRPWILFVADMFALPILVVAICSSLPIYKIYYAWLERHRSKRIRYHKCQAPRSVSSKRYLLGLDVLVRMYQSYSRGRRNSGLKQQFDVYGHTFHAKPFGATRIFTIEPRNLKSVFGGSQDWGIQQLRLDIFKPFVGEGVLNVDGNKWKHARALIQPTFDKVQFGSLHDFDAHLKRLINIIPSDGSTVDLQPLFSRLNLDSVTEYLLGESVMSLESTTTIDAKDFLESYSYGQAKVGKGLQLPLWTLATLDFKFRKACTVSCRFVDKYVDMAFSRPKLLDEVKEKKFILAHELAKMTKNRPFIRSQLLNVFMAGYDTITIALTNIFFHMARNPNIYTKLREEVLVCPSDIDTVGLQKLGYLQSIIKESLRLNPPLPLNSRIALCDTIMPCGGGPDRSSPIFVRKGDIVVTSIYALHRREQVYGHDVHSFRPERWEKSQPSHWEFLPFSAGPRVCPAQRLALTQISHALFHLARHFSAIENRDPIFDYEEQYKISTENKRGAIVALFAN